MMQYKNKKHITQGRVTLYDEQTDIALHLYKHIQWKHKMNNEFK